MDTEKQIQAEASLPSAAPLSQPATDAMRRTLNVLMDVDLPIRILFGRTRIRLKDLVALKAGSIIELDRPAEAQVDILVNSHVIARGEVVVMDGNYGVKITEIVSRERAGVDGSGDLLHLAGKVSY